MSFLEQFNQYRWDDVSESILDKTKADVELALGKEKGRRGLEDFKALISPAAAPFLEEMA